VTREKALELVRSLGIRLYYRADGSVNQHPPGEALDPPPEPNSLPHRHGVEEAPADPAVPNNLLRGDVAESPSDPVDQLRVIGWKPADKVDLPHLEFEWGDEIEISDVDEIAIELPDDYVELPDDYVLRRRLDDLMRRSRPRPFNYSTSRPVPGDSFDE